MTRVEILAAGLLVTAYAVGQWLLHAGVFGGGEP
jgi:hypothetical protein